MVVTNQPPVITSLTPTNGTVYAPNDFISIYTSGYDSDGYIYSIEIDFDSVLLYVNYASTLNSYTVFGASPGPHTITVTITDNQGATATETVTITISNQPPTATITSPLNGASYLPADYIYLYGNASDPDGTVNQLDYYLDGVLSHTDYYNAVFYSWTGLSVGSHTLQLVATDNLGARGSNSVTITVQPPPSNQPPVVFIHSPANNTSYPAGSIVPAARASTGQGRR